ncbi:ankyrin repeat and BTB/POZ domain-containing protein 1-like isoform X1 [Daphnia pulicaria]|uniref:ankyrin repeat and BTB/POZ domain-containing protein 1-like isoform X1 n=1 Tax=Daphnia pulicaria TaxID=35523 RepID=UPI001EEBA9BA|nr:ankyrin repeat and BTB/POZ domain-containing protein 1-like isoform X1 [Daphnia pulicaria]
MDLRELFLSCRSGNLKRIKYLVEQKEVDLNVRDRWDSTPLYYACLCGHVELAEYLLDHGALCEAQTFDGERILYGALTNEIRNKLRNYKVLSSRVVVRDEYEEFLRKLLDLGELSDFSFNIQGESIAIHRFILAARSPYFWEAFKGKWSSKRTVKLQNKLVDLTAFKSIIQYLYSGRLNTLLDEVDECMRLAMQCRLPSLKDRLEEARKRSIAFAETKPGTKIKVLTLESKEFLEEVQRDLSQLAKQAMPSELNVNHSFTEIPSPLLNLVDVCFVVDDHQFLCHKAAFVGRSEYFRALFRDHFRETSRTGVCDKAIKQKEGMEGRSEIDLMTLRDVTPEVFAQVVSYVYSNCVQLSAETVYELLNIGELYLMPGLKKLCANFLISAIDSESVISLIKVSRTFNLPRIEVFCNEFIAKNVEEIVDSEHFHQLIIDDAYEVKGRQEMDSIAIIDDVRYHIDLLHQNSHEAHEKHKMIDRLLTNLNLEA